jgi:hypothetical protein
MGPQTDKHLPQSSFTSQFFLDNDIWHLAGRTGGQTDIIKTYKLHGNQIRR